MEKTIVCITEDEMILNYLFIKEMYTEGDKVLLISQCRLAHIVSHFQELLPDIKIDSIVLAKDGDEDLWDTICRTIRNSLPTTPQNYIVNLSSGTRLMSIAVQQVFERYNAKFYFMPIDRNVIINSHIDDENDNNDDIICPIQHQVSIDEYFTLNGIKNNRKEISQSAEYTEHFYTLFTQNHLSNSDHEIIDQLRENRNRKTAINEIHGLENFLNYINFPLENSEFLTKYETQYLTGNWFEEHIYHLIRQAIDPCDIAIGVDIQRNGSINHNDLDVVFTFNNRLFAIECKTGVGRTALYNQIVYKACALKESLLGIRSNAYIFSLNEDHKENLTKTARNMGITFCGRKYTDSVARLRNLFLNPAVTEIFRHN